jgi:hypothetical protein
LKYLFLFNHLGRDLALPLKKPISSCLSIFYDACHAALLIGFNAASFLA